MTNKVKAWAVFKPDKSIVLGSIKPDEEASRKRYQHDRQYKHWGILKDQGYTIKPVTIEWEV